MYALPTNILQHMSNFFKLGCFSKWGSEEVLNLKLMETAKQDKQDKEGKTKKSTLKRSYTERGKHRFDC